MTQAPALSQLIDMHAFYSRYSQVVGKPSNSRSDGKEWHSSCPKCHGTDRFAFWESGRYSCSIRSSGCGISGSSPYWFLRDVQRLSHVQACDELGIEVDDLASFQKNNLPLVFQAKDEAPAQRWMDAAYSFMLRAQRYLWTEQGKEQREYLAGRGFTEETMKEACLGYCPGWYSESLENWGIESTQTDEQEMKVPPGIVIPWFVSGSIWKLSIRRSDGQGYFQVLGSSDCLFGIDHFKPNMPVCLVESELDALSVHQEASQIVATIATGGASKGQTSKWISLLKQASHVLLSFDTDDAGNAGAAEWQRKLPDALRWRPWCHDCNDMLKSDMSIKQWVELGLKTCQIEIEEPVPETLPIVPEISQTSQIFPDIPIKEPDTPKPEPVKRKVKNPWDKRNEVGLLEFCSTPRCKNKAIGWRSNISMEEAYCEQHKPVQFGR